MKRLLTLALLGASLAHANPYYVSGTVSAERLRYDVNGWLTRKLAVDNRADYLRLFELAGGTLETQTKLTNASYRATLGYQATERLAYELSTRRYQRHLIGATLTAGGELLDVSTTLGGHSARLTANAAGSAQATAELTATSIGAAAVYRVHGPVFVRGGVELAFASVTQTTSDSLSYSYTTTVDGATRTNGKTIPSTTVEKQFYRVALPLLGIGIDYPLSKQLSLRTEVEHVGMLRQGFDFASTTLLYRF
jgi:hypothetical protein